MAEPAQRENSPRTRRLWLSAAIGVLLVAVVIGLALFLTGPRFNDYVRGRVISQIEAATGGRVEMKALHWNLSQLTFEVDDLTIHGLEGPNEVPYAHVDKLLARAKIMSFWRREVGLHSLELQHPVVHLITYADGTTNQPKPKSTARDEKSPVDSIFDLAIERAAAHEGVFILNNRAIPFDFSASDVQSGMTFSQPEQRYDGALHVGKLDMKFTDMRPVAGVVDAQFSLLPKRALVKSLKVSTGRSRVEASGTIDDFNDPKITLAYTSTVDLGEIGGITRKTELRGGTAELRGEGKYQASGFSSNGAVAIRDADYVNGTVHVRKLAATADYAVNSKDLTLNKIAARAFEGNVTGTAVVHNWSSAPTESSAPPQQGTAHFKLSGLSAAELARAVSSSDVPLAKMNLTGAASGDVNVAWKGTIANAVAEFAMDVVPPAQPTPAQLPLTAHVRASVAAGSGRMQLTELSAATRATKLTASGTLGNRNSDLKLSVATTEMGEFKPLLATLKDNQPPVDVHGSASFNGNVSGTLRSPNIAGHVEIRDFDSLLVSSPAQPAVPTTAKLNRTAGAPTSSGTAPKLSRIHWDSLVADVQYSAAQASVRNGVLKRGSAQINLDGTTGLTKGRFTDTSVFNARVSLRNADVTDVQSLLGLNYPVTGIINLNTTVSGSQRDPRGQGRVTLTNATAYNETIKQFTSDIRFANQEAQFTNIDLAHNGSHVTGSAAYNLTSRGFRFNLASTAIDLASIHELRSRVPVAGVMSFTAQGSGTVDRPVINAHVQLTKLVSGGERLGDVIADAVTTGDTMKITARSDYQNSDLRLDGTVRLREDFPAQLTLTAQQVDIDPLLRAYVQGQITAHSHVGGTVELHGPLRHPKLMAANGTIQQIAIEVEHVGIRNDGPIEFALQNQVVTIRRMRLVGDNTELTATGTVELAGARRLDIHADGKVNMRLIQSVNPDFRSEGLVTVAARAGGTISQPAIFGTLKITSGAISYIDLPNGLADINGTLAFNQDRLQIQQLTAKTGGGTLNLGGFVTYGRNTTFNITATAKDMRLRYPQGVSSMADADLRLTGSLKAALLSGDITVTKFGVNPRFDFALYLARAKQPIETPDPRSLLNNLRLDVHITSTPALQVQTSLAKISGNADLRVRGSAARPTLLGRVSIIEGEVFFNGTKYHLERGDITFTNPVRIEPVMDVEATTTVRNYEISLGFHGRTDALSVTYRSDPPLSSADIIQLLAFGRTETEVTQATTPQQTITESASNQILNQALNQAIGNRMQRLFGITRVKIDPNIGGAENNPSGARVTVEQQVANNLTLTYITDLTRSTQQVIQVEYNINRNVSLTAVRDQNGVVGIDIRLRQRKR